MSRYRTPKENRDWKFFYIFCEGKTEVKYFKSFREEFGLNIRPYGKCKSDVQSVVKYADNKIKDIKNKKKDEVSIDKVWIVIDVDSQEKKINEIYEEYNEKYQFAISNPCFEVWLFFHLKDKIPSNYKVTDKKEKSKKMKDLYKKENKSIDKIVGKYKTAVKNAKNAQADNENSNCIPPDYTTNVYKLVEELDFFTKKSKT